MKRKRADKDLGLPKHVPQKVADLKISLSQDLNTITCKFKTVIKTEFYDVTAHYTMTDAEWNEILPVLSSIVQKASMMGMGSYYGGAISVNLETGEGRVVVYAPPLALGTKPSPDAPASKMEEFDIKDPASLGKVYSLLHSVFQHYHKRTHGKTLQIRTIKLERHHFSQVKYTGEYSLAFKADVQGISVNVVIPLTRIIDRAINECKTINAELKGALIPKGIEVAYVTCTLDIRNEIVNRLQIEGYYRKNKEGFGAVIENVSIEDIGRAILEKVATLKVASKVTLPVSVTDVIADKSVMAIDDVILNAKVGEKILLIDIEDMDDETLYGTGIYLMKTKDNEIKYQPSLVASDEDILYLEPEDFVAREWEDMFLVTDITKEVKNGEIDIDIDDESAINKVDRILINALSATKTSGLRTSIASVIQKVAVMDEMQLEPMSIQEIIDKLKKFFDKTIDELTITSCKPARGKDPSVFLVPLWSYTIKRDRVKKVNVDSEIFQEDASSFTSSFPFNIEPTDLLPVYFNKNDVTVFIGYIPAVRLVKLLRVNKVYKEKGGRAAFADMYVQHPDLPSEILKVGSYSILENLPISLSVPPVVVMKSKK